MVVICKNGTEREVEAYLTDVFKKLNRLTELWKIQIFNDTDKLNDSENILVIPINSDLIKNLTPSTKRVISNAKFLMAFDIGDAISDNFFDVDLFLQILYSLNVPEQVILFSDEYINLKEICTKLFRKDFDAFFRTDFGSRFEHIEEEELISLGRLIKDTVQDLCSPFENIKDSVHI